MDVLSVCGPSEPSYWPIAFVALFASFLSIDVGITAFSLYRSVVTVSSAAPKD